MIELTLGQILSRAQEIVRSASSPYEYEPTQQFLNDAKPFGREAFDAAIQLLDGDLDEKILGCDLLSTLLNPDNNAWGHEAAAALVHISDDASDDDLCIFATRALGLSNDPLSLPSLIRMAEHRSSAVRFNAACAIPSCWRPENAKMPVEEKAVSTLMSLMQDQDDDVRNYATFGIARLLEVDSSQIRKALKDRLSDHRADVRLEAIYGLARRHDLDAVGPLIEVMQQGCVSQLTLEAARNLANESLLEVLRNFACSFDADVPALRKALDACDPIRQSESVVKMSQFLETLTEALSVLNEPHSAYLHSTLFDNEVLVVVSNRNEEDLAICSFEALLAQAHDDSNKAASLVLSHLGLKVMAPGTEAVFIEGPRTSN